MQQKENARRYWEHRRTYQKILKYVRATKKCVKQDSPEILGHETPETHQNTRRNKKL